MHVPAVFVMDMFGIAVMSMTMVVVVAAIAGLGMHVLRTQFGLFMRVSMSVVGVIMRMFVFVSMKGGTVIAIVMPMIMNAVVVIAGGTLFPVSRQHRPYFFQHQPSPNDGDKAPAERFEPSLGPFGLQPGSACGYIEAADEDDRRQSLDER